MTDKFFSFLSEWAPVVAVAGCFWCALYGSIEMTVAYGVGAVVLELCHIEHLFFDTLLNISEEFDNEFGGNG